MSGNTTGSPSSFSSIEGSDAAFHLKDLSLGYQGREVLWLDEVVVPQGRMVFVIGPSGAGKSTLLETIGLMSDTFITKEGTHPAFRIKGEAFAPERLWREDRGRLSLLRREHFSFIFQSTNLMPNFTIGENIRMAAFEHGENGAAADERIRELMDALQLPMGTLDKPAHAISGGQRQRVAFIRALVKDFSILLADEPTGNLDPENALILFHVLKDRVVASGRTAVIVTHHLELADRFGDVILELVAAKGTAQAATVRTKRSLMPA